MNGVAGAQGRIAEVPWCEGATPLQRVQVVVGAGSDVPSSCCSARTSGEVRSGAVNTAAVAASTAVPTGEQGMLEVDCAAVGEAGDL